MRHTDIVAKVRTILNEHGDPVQLSITDDNVMLDDYIENAIGDAVTLLASKGHEVNVKMIDKWGGLPLRAENATLDDFISLIEARSPLWNRTVTKLLEKEDTRVKMANNPYAKPGPNKPIGWRVPEGEKDFLHFEPSDIDGTGVEVSIRYNAKYDKDTGLKATEKEATAVCYMAAALTAEILGDVDTMNRLAEITTGLLQ